MQTNDIELKQYSVEKAIESGSIDNMEKIYNFLTPDVTIKKDKGTNVTHIVHKKLPSLTKAQRGVLFHTVELSRNGVTCITGQTVADRMKVSNGAISYHMQKLVRHGYVQRQGQQLFVCYLANGNAFIPTVKRYPVGAAKGYKLQDIAGIKTKERISEVYENACG